MAHNYNGETSLEKVKRHTKYYLSGGDIHFLVEHYIFRVHRYFFERESAYFREKFAVAAPPGQQPRGSSDTNTFLLEDVRAQDFARFLWVFYNPIYSIYDATVDDWSAILKLAFDWRFPEVKKLCVRELEKFEIAPLQKIELYQAYELDKKLLIPSYIAMCMRPEPLSIKEGRQLGLETALLLATAREAARGRPSGSPGQLCSSPVTALNEDMVAIIKDVFGIIVSPPSPSLTPLENTGNASLSTTPVTKGMNGTTTSPKKLTLATPSRTDAATAVASSLGPSSTSTVVAAKDAAKSPGQFASNSSPTILNGRLNSVFAPMQGTVRPPPLEPPPRAPSQVAQTPVLETSPVTTEEPMKQTKREKAKLRKMRQQERKQEVAPPPQAGERITKTTTAESQKPKEAEPSGVSTSTPDVISTQLQSDAPTLVDIPVSTPTTAMPQQPETVDETATTVEIYAGEGQSLDSAQREAVGSVDSQDLQADEDLKVDGSVAESGTTPACSVPDAPLLVDTSPVAVALITGSALAGGQVGSGPLEGAATSETLSAGNVVEGAVPTQSVDGANADTSATTQADGSDPALQGGDTTESSVKEDKAACEGSNAAGADVNDNKKGPADGLTLATEAPTEGTSQSSNGDALLATAADEAVPTAGDVTAGSGVETSEPQVSMDSSAPSAVSPATDVAISSNTGSVTASSADPASSSITDPILSNADPVNLSGTDPVAPSGANSATSSSAIPIMSGADAHASSTTGTAPVTTAATTEPARTPSTKPNLWGQKVASATTPDATRPATPQSPRTQINGSAEIDKSVSPVGERTVVPPTPMDTHKSLDTASDQQSVAPPTGNGNSASAATAQSSKSAWASKTPPWGKNGPPAGGEKTAGTATEQSRAATPKPTIITDVPNALNKPPAVAPTRFSAMIAKAQGKVPGSADNNAAGSKGGDQMTEQALNDASPIPGAWQESNLSAPPKSARGSTESDQPPELVAERANNASTVDGQWDLD